MERSIFNESDSKMLIVFNYFFYFGQIYVCSYLYKTKSLINNTAVIKKMYISQSQSIESQKKRYNAYSSLRLHIHDARINIYQCIFDNITNLF